MANNWMRSWRESDAQQQLPLGIARSPSERTFRHADVPSIRRFAVEFANRAGIGAAQLADFVLAVNEAAACVITAGSCTARLRLWMAGARAFCAVSGDSMPHHGPGGGMQGDVEALRSWLLHQLCDSVSVQSGPDGVTVLLSITVT
jgi:hypothetical protein